VTLEARQDVVYHRPVELASLCLQAGTEDLIQASEAIDGRVKHREGIGNRHWRLRHWDGAHPKWHQCRACLAGPLGNALDPGTMFCLEIFEGLSGGLHSLGTRRRLRHIELADLLLQLPLLFLCFELMLSQQLASPGQHFFPEGEICLSPGEIHLLPVQGQLLLLKVFLSEGDVTGLALELLLPFLQPFHDLYLLGPLGFQCLVQSTQFALVLRREGLPLGHSFLPPSHFLLPPGRLQLPGTHTLEVFLVLLVVLLELGPLGGELPGCRLGALLQLDAPVTEALVLSFKCLPLPQYCCLSFTKNLVGAGQHAGEGDWRRFLLGTRLESPPKYHLHLLRSRRGDGAGRAPCVTSSVGNGHRSPSWDLLRRGDAT
jgi:hypothetical protein